MSRQLKNIIVTLMILLNVCVVVYFYSDIFTGNSDPLVKQAAVQQPVSAPQLAQPPVQQTAYQPPVQQPIQTQPNLTPQQLEQQAARAECNQNADRYWHEFMKEWPRKFDNARGNRDAELQIQHEYKQYRDAWRNYQVLCKGKTQGAWGVNWGAEIENYARKNDCDVSAGYYEHYFREILNLRSTAERDAYVQKNFGRFGKNNYREYSDWYSQLKDACSRDLSTSGGWKAPDVEKLIEQIRTSSR